MASNGWRINKKGEFKLENLNSPFFKKFAFVRRNIVNQLN